MVHCAWRRLGAAGSILWLLAGMVAPFVSSAAAQIPEESSDVAVYRVANVGVPTKAISVWGAVRATGRYEVALNMELLQLLTIAGGPTLDAAQSNKPPQLRVKISRGAPGQRSIVFESMLADITSKQQTYPELLDGDILIVEAITRNRFNWRDAITVLSSLGTLALVTIRVLERG